METEGETERGKGSEERSQTWPPAQAVLRSNCLEAGEELSSDTHESVIHCVFPQFWEEDIEDWRSLASVFN